MQDVVVTKAETFLNMTIPCIFMHCLCDYQISKNSASSVFHLQGRDKKVHFYRIPQIQSTTEYIINKGVFFLFVSPRAAGQLYLSGACQLIHIIS